MTRGLAPDQIGVTEAMIAAYGDFIWENSLNVQIRRGDPVRQPDRAQDGQVGMGLSDQQMADRLGLACGQVTQIRVLLEARRYRRTSYRRLLDLGGNKRFRAETFLAHEDRPRFSEAALALRAALAFDPERVRTYVANGGWADDTLTRWLKRAPAERIVAVGDGVTLTYGYLRERAEGLARGLFAKGVGPGDVVSVQLPNGPEFLIAYVAIARLGAVLSTVHMPYRAAEMRTLLSHTRARAFIGLSRVKDFSAIETVRGLAADLPDLAAIVAVGEPMAGATSFAHLIDEGGPLPAEIAAQPADPFLLLFTSGTSSSPKAVPLTYQMTLGNARLGAVEHRIGPDDRILSAAPYSHLLGLYSLHLAFAVGAANQILPVFTPPDLLAAIERHRPTVLFTAPAHMAFLDGQGLLDKADLSSLKLVIVSGSACPPELARRIASKLPNGTLTQLWGMTELQAGLYTRPADPLEMAATSVGRPCPLTDIRIADAADQALPDGQEGELQIRGPLLFAGYHKNDEANRQGFSADGWFRTEDLAVRNADGTITISGRKKDVINRGGVKYNTREIEDLLAAHPRVLQAAIVPYPDPILGEKACVFVVAREGGPPDLKDLCAWLDAKGVAKTKWPERLEIIDEMPMTPTRKVIKGRLKERLAPT